MVLHKRTWRAAMFGIRLLQLACTGAVAFAQPASAPVGQAARTDQATGSASRAQAAAIKHVIDAVGVVHRMVAEPGMKSLLAQAKGVFIVPSYGRAALGVGASGGAGLLSLRRSDGTWTDPVFYALGGVSVGAQAGAEGGPIALILMNDKAAASFRQKNNFSLSADAGLTVVNFNKMAQGTAGAGDVVAWAGTKGLFGNVATLAVRDVHYNARANDAYYGRPTAIQDVAAGKATNPHSDPLKQVLATASAPAR
jgi:lipid-binding SYLF domain-containing protein